MFMFTFLVRVWIIIEYVLLYFKCYKFDIDYKFDNMNKNSISGSTLNSS